MAYRARFWKKIRRWIVKRLETDRMTYRRSEMSKQVGKLLGNRESEIITMTTL